MNKGGRPLGSASLQKRIEEQKRDEEEHPEKRDQKHEQRLNFFTPGFFVRRTPVQSMKPHGWEGGIDRALELEGRRDDGPAAPPQLIPTLSLLQKGKRVLFTNTAWSNGVTDISCACVQKPAIAGGGVV